MKLRWRKRPSATVLHFSVLMTFGSALPLAINSSRPVLSIGARQPVRAVLATAWFIAASSPVPDAPGRALDTDRSVYAWAVPVVLRCGKPNGVKVRGGMPGWAGESRAQIPARDRR